MSDSSIFSQVSQFQNSQLKNIRYCVTQFQIHQPGTTLTFDWLLNTLHITYFSLFLTYTVVSMIFHLNGFGFYENKGCLVQNVDEVGTEVMEKM